MAPSMAPVAEAMPTNVVVSEGTLANTHNHVNNNHAHVMNSKAAGHTFNDLSGVQEAPMMTAGAITQAERNAAARRDVARIQAQRAARLAAEEARRSGRMTSTRDPHHVM